MPAFLSYLREINIVSVVLRIALAMVVGGVTGLERGKQGRAAGMRTHILVCLGATLTSLLGFYTTEILGYTNDPLRVAAQVVSGIGFLGVGTILIKGRFQITGLTTAAGLWCAATVGLALGAGFYEAALATFLSALLTITVIHRLEYTINKRHYRFGIYVEVEGTDKIRSTITKIEETYHITDVQVTAPRSAIAGNVGIEAIIHNKHSDLTPDIVTKQLEEIPSVVYAIESI